MSVKETLNLVEGAWVDALSAHDSKRFLAAHSESVTMYDPTFPQPSKGKKALEVWFNGLLEMFPDYKVQRLWSFGNGEWVCVECVESGTLEGPIHTPGGDVPPTHKSFKSSDCIVCKVEAGKIAEIRLHYDVLGLMAQLGMKP